MYVDIHNEDKRGNVIRLIRPVRVHFRDHDFVIHAGFECDGVSVPRIFWPLVSPHLDPHSLRAGVAHDFIYRTQPDGWTRYEADLMFFCFLLEDGLGVTRSKIAYDGVRLGGWCAWNKNEKLLRGAM